MALTPNQVIPEVGAEEDEASIETVTISRAELESLRARAAENFTASSKSEVGAGKRFESLTDESVRESQLTKELTKRDERVTALERICKGAVRDRELATMLAGKPLVTGAAVQLIKLWRDEFDVYEEDGTYKVAARDGRNPTQVVGEWLSSPEYSHFCLPTSRGGTGAKDANRPSPPISQTEGPKNLGEAIVMKWREESVSRSNGLVKPIGLKRHR